MSDVCKGVYGTLLVLVALAVAGLIADRANPTLVEVETLTVDRVQYSDDQYYRAFWGRESREFQYARGEARPGDVVTRSRTYHRVLPVSSWSYLDPRPAGE